MMLAFHNDPKIKAKYLKRVRAHAKADEIIHGRYWENGKGCAVGCTIHSATHADYETELGIPLALARLEDTLFEGQSNGAAKTFPARFLAAITPGADLSRVSWQFLHWLLTEELAGRDHPLVAAAIKQCADVLRPLTKGEPVDASAAAAAARSAAARSAAARSVAAAARSAAAWSAESAAESAAWSAARSAAAAAWSAAWAAASAARAAESAESAAWSAAWSAARSAAESAAWSAAAAKVATYIRMADKLIDLLKAAV